MKTLLKRIQQYFCPHWWEEYESGHLYQIFVCHKCGKSIIF